MPMLPRHEIRLINRRAARKAAKQRALDAAAPVPEGLTGVRLLEAVLAPRCPSCSGPLAWCCVVCGANSDPDDGPEGRTPVEDVVEVSPAFLRRIQWGFRESTWGPCCPYCGATEAPGHFQHCALQAALSRSTTHTEEN